MFLVHSHQRRIFIVLIASSVLLYGLYVYWSRHMLMWRTQDDDSDRVASNLILSSDRANDRTRSPLAWKCKMYQEFRQLDFLHPVLRHRLCRGVEAYKRYPDGYPLCELQNPFNEDMLNIVRRGSEVVRLDCINNMSVQLFAYQGNDLITNDIRNKHTWEPGLLNWTLKFALKVPQATFLDMGSNIGAYSIQAAKLGLPVVSLDANIRNLLRLRLTLNAASLDAALVWNFIAPDQSLKYLGFYSDCNVGGAGMFKADLPDTVPVMPISSEKLSSLVKTKNIVMKMDIQGGEPTFLEMSGRLFTDFRVAAVQLEWYPPFISAKEAGFFTQFFVSRGYRVWKLPGFLPLDPKKVEDWKEMDVLWIHKDFIHLL